MLNCAVVNAPIDFGGFALGQLMSDGKHAHYILLADTTQHLTLVSGTRAIGLFRRVTDGVIEEFGCNGVCALNLDSP